MLVTGGSGSGKSEYAENRLLELRADWSRKGIELPRSFYIATMYPYDEESRERVKKHQHMRATKQFDTLECYTNLKQLKLQQDCFLLVECMSNLIANERYMDEGCRLEGEAFVGYVMEGVKHCIPVASHVVIVTNEVNSDGIAYDRETMEYMRLIGQVNQRLAALADEVVEIVYGIPVKLK